MSCPGQESGTEKQKNKDELKKINPPFRCVSCQKSTSVKLLLSLCRDSSELSLAPPEPGVLFVLHREALCVPVAARRTVCNRTPDCRAAPQTMCLRSLRGGGGERVPKSKKNKTVLLTETVGACAQKAKRSGGGRRVRCLLPVPAAHLTSEVLMAEECAPTSRVGEETWQRRTAVLQVEGRNTAH